MSDRLQLTWKGGALSLHRCRVMGILNLTPDSFYDGGKYTSVDAAMDRAWEMVDEGADIIDIGAESTRPGSPGISIEEEKNRLFPVLQRLAEEKFPLPVSLDTSKPEVLSEACSQQWVQIANDITGLRNPAMVFAIVSNEIPVILMHMFGTPQTMQQDFHYEDVVKDLIDFFRKRLGECRLKTNVVLDPGLCFGKSVQHNLEILQRLKEFQTLGFPILIGASRKSFIGEILKTQSDDRLEGSLAAAAVAVSNGAKILRVHDVKETVRTVQLVESIMKQKSETISKDPI